MLALMCALMYALMKCLHECVHPCMHACMYVCLCIGVNVRVCGCASKSACMCMQHVLEVFGPQPTHTISLQQIAECTKQCSLPANCSTVGCILKGSCHSHMRNRANATIFPLVNIFKNRCCQLPTDQQLSQRTS